MTDTAKTLTSAEFSKITGIPVSTVNRMLRQGKLRGEKRSGKWAIHPDELPCPPIADRHASAPESATAAADTVRPAARGKRYDIDSFARMTYLTETGVRRWLKDGRLTGGTDADGRPFIDAANLERRDLQHLIRR